MMAGRDPFEVDEDKALDVLMLAWAVCGYEVFVVGGQWQAWHRDADDTDVIDGSTPDELNRAIRADWTARQARMTS